jgi:hypothetical protein
MKTFSHLWQYLAEFFLEWEMFETDVVEKIKTRISCSVTFFSKIVPFTSNFEKSGAREAKKKKRRYNMAHARRMLDKQGYMRASTFPYPCTHTHARAHAHTEICSTYSFSTATAVLWTRVSVTLHVHCLSCLFWLNKFTPVCCAHRHIRLQVYGSFSVLATRTILNRGLWLLRSPNLNHCNHYLRGSTAIDLALNTIWTREAMCYNVTLRRVHVTIVAVEKQLSIKYYECVSVFLPWLAGM